ncbi:Gfo/Idh/MocA family protein [Brevibacillus migulae]|uniref:Gfo/Idh/MocA family protein n=1 Tax=Brevibacillus migulae TaxID=1644114 RepID=UPI00106ED35C|nr:Gfo/Idh/MocA family oxidoreductase [Brevibacillus migulae]
MHHVLVVGAGTMGSVHARSFARMENVKLAGIVDIRANIVGPLAESLQTQAFASYEEAMAALERVDIVDICLPTDLHKTYVLKAAAAGKHVICEKPLAGNLADAQEMIDFCRERNVKLFVGHVLRFFPEYVQAKRLVDSGAIGEVAMVNTFRGGIFPTAWKDWYADVKISGGLILDMIIHDFDFLRWCFGEVERVYAKSMIGRTFARMEYALVSLRFANGVIAHIEGSWAHQGFSMKFELAGKKGVIDYDSRAASPVVSTLRKQEAGQGGVAVPESPLRESPYFLELQHFLAAIERETEPLVTPEDAYKAMEIALAALKSIETGKPVSLAHSAGKGGDC